MKTREELLKEYEPHKPQKGEIVGWFKAADYDDIKQILGAPTQKQLDCQYCHGTDNLNDTTNRNNDFQIKIDLYGPDDARLNVEYRGGADREIAHINYCPICGYRLKGASKW